MTAMAVAALVENTARRSCQYVIGRRNRHLMKTLKPASEMKKRNRRGEVT